MKRSLILIVLIALPALADEQSPVQDSPLVAAAKRSKMAKKTAVVITNKTLKQSGAGAHITTTKKQAPLPKMQNAAPIELSKVAAAPPKAKPKRQTTPHDDAERLEDDPGRGDLVHCPSCLPILEPVSPTLPLREAEFSTNPPKVATPELPQIVPPRPPEAPPLF
ncbi:MAG: hypothetical protein AABO58_12190 [Acidobacteriota bacterium]